MLKPGQRGSLRNLLPQGQGRVELLAVVPQGAVDFSCFALGADGRLNDDRDCVFANNPTSRDGGVVLVDGGSDHASFAVTTGVMKAGVQRLVFVASVEAPSSMAELLTLECKVGDELLSLTGSAFTTERSLLLIELYRRDAEWRYAINAQGFAGGLAAVIRHFGGHVEDAAPAPAAPPSSVPRATPSEPLRVAPTNTRLPAAVRLPQVAPSLSALYQEAGERAVDAGLGRHRAKVALCLDISASMAQLYASGAVQALAERVLALACRFDDDGEIEVFLFGVEAHRSEAMSLENHREHLARELRRHPLESGTDYAAAMRLIRRHYFGAAEERGTPYQSASGAAPQLPVYLLFLTDGDSSNRAAVQAELRSSAYEPIFWQFVGIGPSEDFSFLEKLDDMKGRWLDNADFFAMATPTQHSDKQLFKKLLTEYPRWVRQALEKALISR